MSLESVPSYQKIHYLLRPAKNVQRKMLCDGLRRLGRVRELADYQYVGFGSMYYGDFILFHKALGIQNMYSIEYEKGAPRAEFNKPFSCVTVLAGTASTKLIEVNWRDAPSIVWLDYDYGLEKEVLHEIEQVVANAQPNSMLIVTLDSAEKGLLKLRDETDVTYDFDAEEFENQSIVGKLNLKCGTGFRESQDLRGDGIAEAYRTIINETISKSINTKRVSSPQLNYNQVFNFRYSDGREMMTIGGVICPQDAAGRAIFKEFGFEKLDFVRKSSDPFIITAPKLTLREIRELNRALPCTNINTINVPIPDDDKILYQRLYRYFPTFTEAEL